MQTQIIIGTISVEATAALIRQRFVGFTGAIAAPAAPAIGISELDMDTGEMAPINTHGALMVKAGAAIAVGAEVEVGADGKAITLASGVAQGRALDAATADGDIIRILR
ncbi:MAG: DUF2190 domain-containing protein [Candidatus Latescibacterota bacterium]|nr:MAG: DUF2190 domain-containing protein [Candidatus Latescibacterota bacterium]